MAYNAAFIRCRALSWLALFKNSNSTWMCYTLLLEFKETLLSFVFVCLFVFFLEGSETSLFVCLFVSWGHILTCPRLSWKLYGILATSCLLDLVIMSSMYWTGIILGYQDNPIPWGQSYKDLKNWNSPAKKGKVAIFYMTKSLYF